MTQSIPTALKKAIWTRFEQKYGAITIDFTRFIWEEDDTFTLEFSISREGCFIAHYYGKVAYDALGLVLDIAAVE